MRRFSLLGLFVIVTLTPMLALGQPVAVSLVNDEGATTACFYEVTVNVSTGGVDMARSQFTLEYSSSCLLLDPDGISLGDGLDPADFSVAVINFNPGFSPTPMSGRDSNVVIVVDPAGLASYSGTGVEVLRLQFQWVGTEGGNCAVAFDQRVLPAGVPTQLTSVTGVDYFGPGLQFSGETSVRPFFTLSGSLFYYGPDFEAACEVNPPVPGAIVTLTDGAGVSASIPTDAAGGFSFPGLVAGTYDLSVSRLPMGADFRAISGADAVLLFQATAGAVPVHPKQETAGDVAGAVDDPVTPTASIPNGLLDGADPIAVSNWLAFLRNPLDAGATATWFFDILPSGAPSTQVTLGCDEPDVGDQVLCIEGYFLGDANASWLPTVPKRAPDSPMTFALEELGRDGNEILVGLDADLAGETLESVLYSLDYDPNLRYVGMEATDEVQGFYTVDNPSEPGVVHGALIGGRSFAKESGRILSFRFELLDPERPASISFSRLEANDQQAKSNTLVFGKQDAPPDSRPDVASIRCAPNPFNPSTQITYTVPTDASAVPVKLHVYDASGRLVRELVNTEQGAGTYTVTWTGTDAGGRAVSTGVYYLRLQAGQDRLVYKTALVK